MRPIQSRSGGKAFAGLVLVDLLAIVAVLAILIALVAPVASRAKELSKRRLCSLNLKSIGRACKIYANDNLEKWPIPPFRSKASQSSPNIDYVHDDISTGIPNIEPGEVGFERYRESTSRTFQTPNSGSTAVSTTRSFWILVRSGDLHVQQFVCPSSMDAGDPTENIDLYYDFTEYANISYGYQVPFGPRDTQPREGVDNRRVMAADQSPFYTRSTASVEFRKGDGSLIEVEDTPREWQRFNSPNHGGVGMGEGQNCLFPDGHVAFRRRPTAGLDNDNIYTVMTDEWEGSGFNRSHGETVQQSPFLNPFPGQGAFGSGFFQYSSTDSLIYP